MRSLWSTLLVMLALGVHSPAYAQPASPSDAAVAAFDEEIEQARSTMMSAPAEALANAEAAEALIASLPRPIDRTEALATAWWLRAEALTRLNRVDEAGEVTERALDLVEGAGEPTKILADLLTVKGRIAKLTGDFDVTFSATQRAYEIYSELGEARSEAIALQSIGYVYFAAQQYDRVLEYFQRANDVYPDDDALRLSALNNVANALTELGRHAEAAASYEEALDIAATMKSAGLQARILNNLANVRLATGDLDGAEDAIRRALELAEAQAGAGWARFLFGVQAEIEFARGRNEQARDYYERTFEGVDFGATTQNFFDFHESAAIFYAEAGEWKLAHAHHTAFKRLDDERRNIAAAANTALLDIQFDVAQKELQIGTLKRQQLEQDIALREAQTRQRLIWNVSAIAILSLLVASSIFAMVMLRKSRDEQRRVNLRLSYMNTKLEASQAELERALVAANAAAEAKAAFLANMSHELRTPLNAIIGFADHIKQETHGPLSPTDYLEPLTRIHDGGQKMLKIVKGVLELSSITQEEMRERAKDVVVGDMIDDAVASQRLVARKCGVKVNLSDDNLNDRVNVDEKPVRRAIEAVINNALHFSPAGEDVCIRVGADDQNITISVRDEGPGMDEETLARVFDPFEKGDNSLTTEHQGIGIGLTLARANIEANGGSLALETSPNGGTTALFVLPRGTNSADLRDAA